ncbi:hypothetical protein MGAST_06330 [Mycobacterium gastri 'Wayne']|uniref:Glucose-methanol-choline oxidoreductase C-terminal domain-containing protein n=1 Tax=Mycobacterium gastri TaxID=1777 RepID=A0A1X1VHP5_MYCGS|nr:hypothetical protein MGAST_06330 [Mycobacterium gastri 'Wayne']ORV68537.1 hypothetical protein AWC07_07755 [Mycobacterium gastri]
MLLTRGSARGGHLVEEAEYFVDRVLRNVAHGRFERSLSDLTAFAALVTTAEVYFEHYRASFGNKWMWSPIVVTPPVVVTGVPLKYSTQVITNIRHAAGAQDVLTIQRFAHLIGGARMGSDPQTSVVNSDQRTWAVPNLFIADGSVCPTQGSANPALTIMALASRLAERIVRGDVRADALVGSRSARA